MKECIVLVVLILFSSLSIAANDFFVVPKLGYCEYVINSDVHISGNKQAEDKLSPILSVGYRVNESVTIEVEHTACKDLFSIFSYAGHTEYIENSVYVGYSTEIASNLVLTPSIGYAWWDLSSAEGATFLGLGSIEENSISGEDFTYKLNAEYKTFYTSYRYVNYSFGRISILSFGVKYEF